MKRTAKYLFLVLMITGCQLLVHTKSSHAQSNTKAFRHFTPQDGFPTYIIDLYQDNKGQIWTTGPSGLSRFDGYDLKSYVHDPNDEFSVPEGSNYYLLVDNKGLIWLSGQYGVSYYDPALEQFHTITLPDSLPAKVIITSLIQTKDDYIWTTNVNGLYRYTPPSEEQPQPEMRFFSNGLDEADRISYFELLEGPDGLIWLRSSRGVYHFNRETNTFSSAINNEDIPNGLDVLTWAVGDMAISPDNAIWIGFQGGILVFKPGNPDPELITSLGDDSFDLSDVLIGTIIFARDGTLWIGTETHGALHFDPLTNELIQYTTETKDTDGIFENPVTTIFEDSDGNIWFGFENNGMSVMYDKTWNYAYKKIDEMLDATHPTNSILHLVSDQSSNVWAATSNGLAFIPEDGGPPKVFLPSPETPATSRTRNENWIAGISLSDTTIYALGVGRESSFVYIFDINDEQFTTVPIPDSLRIVQRFAATESTLYWRAFGIYQLVALNKNDLSFKTIELPFAYPTANTAAASDTLKIVNPMVSHSGDLYIQVMNSIGNSRHIEKWDYYKYEPDQDTFSKIVMTPITAVRLSRNREAKFSSSSDSNIVWSVTDRGILVENLDSGSRRFTHLGFNPNEVRSGGDVMDEDGFIWMSEARAVINKIDLAGSNVNSYPLDRGRQVSFMYRSVQLPNGTIMFGGDGGYIQFDPDKVREVSNIQKLFITEFMAGTNDIVNVSTDETYEIEYANNNISFSYLGINYRSPNNRYRYRLLGYSDDWTDVDMQRTISFANLPIGAYTFEVQAVTPGSSFSDESTTATVNFVILPPWWRTTMAYFSYAVLIGGFVVSADRFQRKRLIQKERDRARDKELEQAKEIEKAYQNLELAHGNLISAQEQLIQQEKLASLGQLTAGIAHEIKNPLNFVNNFSSVSLELVDEAMEEVVMIETQGKETQSIASPQGRAPLQDLSDLLSDIKSNLAKIHEHGSRADGIVKSMLQHSRGGSGKMEPADLNEVVKEFVNLSYHGMRAGKHPFDVEMSLDLDDSIGEIPLVQEDFSRVIVNICSNAFDAMRGSVINDQGSMIGDREIGSVYTPHLKVRTIRESGRVLIEIEDNGPGIPDEIKDKILQPFFTTKKGTQGTGLGLSITHDIVKAHGGSLDIESQLGQTVFVISLNR